MPEEELNRYKKQFSLVSNVCSEYENEKEDEPDDIKKKRFEKLLGLMQQASEAINVCSLRSYLVFPKKILRRTIHTKEHLNSVIRASNLNVIIKAFP